MNLLSGSANVTTTPAAATTPNNNNINNNHNQHHSSNGGSLVGVNRSGVVSLNATNFIGGVSNSSTGSSLSLLNSANANLTAASMSGSQSIPVIRAPTLRRGRHDAASTPLSQRIDLERVLGLTVSSSAAVAVDPLTATVAYPAGCVVILYNTKTNRQSHIVSPSKKTITSLAFSWDGRFLATGECGHQPQLRVWDVERRQQLAEFPGHKYGINCVAFSPNLKYVVSVGSQHDSVVNVWDWRSDTKVASNKVSAKVKSVTFAASGNFFVTVGNRHVKFWYLEHAKLIANMAEPMPLMGRSAILGDQRNNNFCDADCGKGALHENTYAITRSGLLCVFNSRRLLDKWVELKTSVANSVSVGEDRIFVGCSDGTIRCFDPLTLQFICTLPRPHHLGVDVAKGVNPNAVMYHPENSRYPDVVALTYDEMHKRVTVIYNDHSLYVWSVVEPKRVGKCFSFLFHAACIWGIETYPNELQGLPKGTFLTCSSDDTIRAWNLHDSSLKRNIFCPELLKVVYMDPRLSYITDIDLTVTPAGGNGISGTNGSTEKVDANYDGKNGVRCMKISHDGSHLACGDRSGNITIFGIPQMEQLGKIEAHDSEVLCLEYSLPASCGFRHLLASGSRDRFIHIFDVTRSYQFIKTLADHSSSITALKFVRSPLQGTLSSSGQNNVQMISCGADKQIIFRRAQLSTDPSSVDIQFNREHLVSGKCTLFDMELDSAEKHVLTACQDRHVRVYSVTSSKNTRTFRGAQGDDGTLIKVVLDPSGAFVATSCTDKSIYVYDYSTGECQAIMSGHSELVTGLRFSNDGRNLISVSGDGCIFIWRLPADITSQIRSKLGLPDQPVSTVDNTIIWSSGTPSDNHISGQTGLTAVLDANGNASLSSASPTPADDVKLPNWAKKRVGGSTDTGSSESNEPPGAPLAAPPRGKWAQSVGNMEQGGSSMLVIKSVLASDPVVHLPRLNKSKSEGAVNVVVHETEADDDGNDDEPAEATLPSTKDQRALASGAGAANPSTVASSRYHAGGGDSPITVGSGGGGGGGNGHLASFNNRIATNHPSNGGQNPPSASLKQGNLGGILRSHSPPTTLLSKMRLSHHQQQQQQQQQTTDSSGASSMKTTGDEDADCERSDTDQSEKMPTGTHSARTPVEPAASSAGPSPPSTFGARSTSGHYHHHHHHNHHQQQQQQQPQHNASQPSSSGSSSGYVDLVEARRRLRSRGGPKDLQQELANSDLNSDSDRDSTTTPSKLGDKNSLFMSTENLERLGLREKFMKSNYETLGRTVEENSSATGLTSAVSLGLSRKSITAKFKTTPGSEPVSTEGNVGPDSGRKSSIAPLRTAQQQALLSEKAFNGGSTSLLVPPTAHLKPQSTPGAKKPVMSPWATGNHREELSKALQEAKQRLQGVGKGHKLSTSKSIGDLLSLKERKDFGSDTDKTDKDSSRKEELIRRSTSMSDLGGAARMLTARRRHNAEETENSGSLSASGGIWAQAQKTPFSTYATTPRKYGTSMSRSASMGSLNSPSVYAAATAGQATPTSGEQLLGPAAVQGGASPTAAAAAAAAASFIHRAPSAHSLRRTANSNLTKVRSSSALNRNSLINKHPLSPDSDSDSDSESTTISDAMNHRHSLSRSFSRQSQVGLVTPHSGQQLNQQTFQRGQFTLPRRYSSQSGGHGEGPRALVEPMPQQQHSLTGSAGSQSQSGSLLSLNVNQQPLSQELCDRVGEELKRVTRQAIQLFQRVTLTMDLPPSMKSTMTQSLASSVLQAQQHLSLAAPPASSSASLGHHLHHHSLAASAHPGAGSPSLMAPLLAPQQPQQPNVTLDASALSMLLGGSTVPNVASAGTSPAVGPDPTNANNPINNVLQQYTQHILKMVEEKISQAKPAQNNDQNLQSGGGK